MLSESIKQTSSNFDNLQNSQDKIQNEEKMMNTIDLSVNSISDMENDKMEEDNSNLNMEKKEQHKTSNEEFNSIYQLQNLSHINKYLNESSNLKFNNSEEFKEYQKYKEDLVNKIKNNKITTNKILNKDSIFDNKTNIKNIINSNTFSQENSTTIQDEYFHENPKTEPNSDIIVVSNADDTTVVITESNQPNGKNYYFNNQNKYQTNNINRYNSEYKSYIPISSNSLNNQVNIKQKTNNNYEKIPKVTQVEIDVTECQVIEKENNNNNNGNSNNNNDNNNSNNNNVKYQDNIKPKNIQNVTNKSIDDNFKKNGYNESSYNNNNYTFIKNQDDNSQLYKTNHSYNIKNKNSYINYANNTKSLINNTNNTNSNHYHHHNNNNSSNNNTSKINITDSINNNNQKIQNYGNSKFNSNIYDHRKSYNKNINPKYDISNKNQ
eukprot:jgi/Orpsp1_1/1177841/evm.model.c7180000063080.1